MQLDPPEEDLRSFALQEDLAGSGKDVVNFVDLTAVDKDRDPVAGAQALDAGPPAMGAFHVLLAAELGRVLPSRILVPPGDREPIGSTAQVPCIRG